MKKETRNGLILAVAILLSLAIGYFVGAVMQTGICPITGHVLSEDRAEAMMDRCKAMKQSCEADEEGCCQEKETISATPEAAKPSQN
jgi:hypothetical protein